MSIDSQAVTDQASHVTIIQPKAAPIPRAKGVDVSSWQHPGGKPIDWHAVKEDGYDFVMIKASQGTTYVNPYLGEDIPAARGAGLIVGAYHFYEQGEPVAEQGANFIAACLGHVLELGAWIDWEPSAMPDYQVQGDYDGLRSAMMEGRRPIGVYYDLYWHGVFNRLNLIRNRIWLGEWSAIVDTQGINIIQRPTALVAGIDGQVDIDELLSIRGVSLPKVATPPALASVAEHSVEVTTPVEEQREPDSEKVAEAADPLHES